MKAEKCLLKNNCTNSTLINSTINNSLTLSILGKNFSRQHFEIFCFFFLENRILGFDNSCKLSPEETICMNCHILFSGKNKKNLISLPSAESAHNLVSVKCYSQLKSSFLRVVCSFFISLKTFNDISLALVGLILTTPAPGPRDLIVVVTSTSPLYLGEELILVSGDADFGRGGSSKSEYFLWLFFFFLFSANYKIENSNIMINYISAMPSPLKHSIVSIDSVCGQWIPDQTARMRRLFWSFPVHIRQRTHFRKAWPIS